MVLGFLNMSSVLLALPVIFRGIGINPLAPGSTAYLLWLLMGYTLVTAVLVVSFGRLGDMFGRTRMYSLGFVIFTVGSLLCAVTWSTGPAGAIELILFRMVQGIGSSFLFANSAAILTDAFPENERGMALGLNQVAGVGGSFLGILVGGLLSQVGWRWVFLINVPLGIAGIIWSYRSLREVGTLKREPIDWLGNLTFAAGLTMILVGVIYGINPSATSSMSWTTPFVLGMFMAPNTAAIMNSLPPQHRGVGSGMRATLINVASPLSMAIIFSLMIVGLNASMPAALYSGLVQNGIPAQIAQQIANAPPVGYLFAAFLGYNPLGTLIPASVLHSVLPQQAATITSRAFFPQLIETAFHKGLVEVLRFSIIMCIIGAVASWIRGGKYVYHEEAKS